MANNINIVITADDKASKPLRAISDEIEGASGKSSKFKSALGSLGGVLSKTTLAAGALAIGVGTAGATIGFGFNSSVEQAQTKLSAFMGDNERVAKTLAWVKTEAAATQFSFTEMADAAANLTPVSRSTGVALEDLVKQAEVLASINPTEGLTGATFSLREALSGDWVSIVDRFNLPRKRINELKEQGVPAMEIISRTLKEMGIDYSLVAKQGQTTAARFDQIKDKLTMLAGAATKPIFERVSRELDTLGGFNYEALGTNLAGVASGALGAFDNLLPRLQAVGGEVGNYLGPKVISLWSVVNEKLAPAMGRLWKEIIQPLIPVIGTALVGALGGAIDAFSLALQVVSPLINFLADNTWVIWGVVGAIAAVKTALAINAAVEGFKTAFVTAIGAAKGEFVAFKALIATPLVMPAIAVAAALGAIALVVDAYNRMKTAMEEAKQAQQYSYDTTMDILKRNAEVQRGPFAPEVKARWQNAANKAIELDKKVKYASGTNSAMGGRALVGEHGAEEVYLPQGATVTPAYRTRSQNASDRSGATVVIQNYNSYNERDDNRFFRDLGFALELRS